MAKIIKLTESDLKRIVKKVIKEQVDGFEEFKQELQVWYNKNKGQSVQEDFVKMSPVL